MPMPVVHLKDVQKRPKILDIVETLRNRRDLGWLLECVAEVIGCFIFVYLGVGASVTRMRAVVEGNPIYTSSLQGGLSTAFGILFGVVVTADTSGGHLSPAFTIAQCIFRGFPKLRAARYVAAQVLGGYLACLFVYYEYRFLIVQMEETLRQRGVTEELLLSGLGGNGIFAFYKPQGQSMGGAFLNEWTGSVIVSIIYWAAIDPTNSLMMPVLPPLMTALAYGVVAWGFGGAGAALNSSREIGGRLWAITIWGLPASGGSYAAMTALTNILAMIFAALVYEIFLGDSRRIVTSSALEQMHLVSDAQYDDTVHEDNSKAEERMQIGDGRSDERGELEFKRVDLESFSRDLGK